MSLDTAYGAVLLVVRPPAIDNYCDKGISLHVVPIQAQERSVVRGVAH